MENKKYSYRSFATHGLSFKDASPDEFNNTEIRGSCFYQEWLDGDRAIVKDIFPDGMKGVTFRNCNLDNVFVPEGNKIIDGTHKVIQAQSDGNDWVLDAETFEPIRNLALREV